MGFPPLGDDYDSNSTAGISLTRSPLLARPADEISQLRDGNANASIQAPSRLAYRQLKPSASGIFSTRSPYSAAGIFSLESQTICTSCWWDFPHSETAIQAPTYGSLSISLRAVKNLHCWDLPYSESSFRCWDFSHLEAKRLHVPLMGFFHSETATQEPAYELPLD